MTAKVDVVNAIRAVPIRLASERYQALIGSDLLSRIGELVTPVVRGPRCAVIADTNTARLYGQSIVENLATAKFQPVLISVPAGEVSKSLERAGAVCDEMAAAGLDRSSFLVAVGGGVVGDLAGFAAAIYHRGIQYVQVPTTLLAQADSSIGGKTAVNTVAAKNVLGALHQAALVIADVDTLTTLPPRELNQGFAEIIKHASIADASLFELLRESSREALTTLVRRSVEIKASIVAQDEHDTTGARAVLNFGHTIGHAVEHAAGYGALLHGEAVSLGMVAACEISVRRAGLSEHERQKVTAALEAFELPTRLPAAFPKERILPALLSDKKFERGQIRFVVVPALGSARLTSDVTLEDIEHAIAQL